MKSAKTAASVDPSVDLSPWTGTRNFTYCPLRSWMVRLRCQCHKGTTCVVLIYISLKELNVNPIAVVWLFVYSILRFANTALLQDGVLLRSPLRYPLGFFSITRYQYYSVSNKSSRGFCVLMKTLTTAQDYSFNHNDIGSFVFKRRVKGSIYPHLSISARRLSSSSIIGNGYRIV